VFLKSLDIFGFKSFADKTHIEFADGITALLGPNGCGKSNVADAIRFCLGEASSKTLRGGKMNDVIFAGTEKRKSLSFCEVTLTFNNKDRIFKSLDFDEVTFTRKLFRDNESEYYINKALCRRIDIIDALRDSGIGREGYSIIGQGKVEELISSKPEDRRAIFDEAAGISKYKARKIESQRKLNKAREMIDRINDLLAYTNANLKPLIADAEKARKYKEIYEKLRHHEINIYLHQYETTSETKAIILGRKNSIVSQINDAQTRYENASNAYNAAMKEFNEIDETLQQLNTSLLEMSVSKQKNEGEIIQRTFIAVQFSIVNFLFEPFRDRAELVPVNEAFLAGCSLPADINIESHCHAPCLCSFILSGRASRNLLFFSSHSQTTIRFQPSSLSCFSVFLSRSTFRLNFSRQNSTFAEGIVACRQPGCRCQKQPRTSTTV